MTCRYCEQPIQIPSEITAICQECDDAYIQAMREHAAKNATNARSPIGDILDAEYLEESE